MKPKNNKIPCKVCKRTDYAGAAYSVGDGYLCPTHWDRKLRDDKVKKDIHDKKKTP